MISLLHGTSLTRQLLEPFVRQVNAVKNVEPIRFWSSGLYSPGEYEYCDGSRNCGFEKNLALDFSVRPNRSLKEKRNSYRRKIEWRIKKAFRPYIAHNNFRAISSEIDVFHCQGMFDARFTNRLLFGHRNLPVVVSCWGSDVFRIEKIAEIKEQKKLLKRANIITVSSIEFREILLAKFGQNFRPKMRVAQFSPNLEGILSGSRTEEGRRFRESLGIGKGKIWVGVAHNAHHGNQHLQIIDGLAKLDKEIKDRLLIVVPMTYGKNLEYIEKVRKNLSRLEIEYKILTDFLEEDEVSGLRLALDIFIFAPQTDSFSATVSQALAAGSECILGSWLPYKARSSAGFLYTEIDSPLESGVALAHVVKNHLGNVARSRINKDLSQSFFDPLAMGKIWRDVYKEAFE